ncbi:NAD(P)-binding protein [Coprinopsis marcescibilis]|uniref:NAD(P)-binding protein n=1 Tax=Coprinopsis marcescibilis TaxID=230819 RepID=A0A5C3LDX9_COPMA|nr:NAD(P)-binding protein [Coprinopsis marcescibilis]
MSPPVVLVTGCTTGGIGYALCEEFARQGCIVYASSRRIDTIAEFTEHSRIERISLDVTDDESVSAAIERIIGAEGKLDILVNNAGISSPGPILEQTMDAVKRVLDTNTISILRVSKAVMPHMAKLRSGLIVNIGSIVGDITTPWSGVYSASKAALASISQVMAMELQPFNIQVIHVAPGAVKSNIAANVLEGFELAENTLYGAYIPDILRRIKASQAPNTMPNEQFARQVVGKALRRQHPFYTYLSLGGNSVLFAMLKWLPKTWVMRLVWNTYSKK